MAYGYLGVSVRREFRFYGVYVCFQFIILLCLFGVIMFVKCVAVAIIAEARSDRVLVFSNPLGKISANKQNEEYKDDENKDSKGYCVNYRQVQKFVAVTPLF